jgi:proline utilization trans-activator
MAQAHGLHTDMQANVGGNELVRRCRRLWWTVYTLDRRFSSSFGVPTSLRDEDVTTPLPMPTDDDDDDESGTAQLLYVQICQLYGRVISSMLPLAEP